MRLQARRLVMLLVGLLVSPALWAKWAVNMPEGVTDLSHSIYGLHMTIFWITVAIGVLVFAVMFWSVIFHRKSRGAKASEFHESTLVEILWTSIPFAILVVMAIPATKTLIEVYDADDADIDIKVTGYQWKWQYEYLGEDVSFFSNLSTSRDEINNSRPKNENYLLEVDEPLVVPIGKKIRFLVTGADVIHSWWVPELAVKKDAIPGFINESWTKINTPGIYRGQCAELCGKDHGFMPIVVDARPMDEYQEWLEGKRAEAEKIKELTQKDWTMDELMTRGEEVYTKVCVACHQANGQGIPPMFPPLKGNAIAVDRDKIGRHIEVLLYGVKGTAMQAFKDQLSEVDMAAVITYERNAWGNNTKEVVTPRDILDYKKDGKYTGQYSSEGGK
ncbi:cytochrome c oxidase subunit II [Sansalvadorimonas sp. 2012CJ34-2]|uniref:Cytochrome c oxidase subunit 2 n=1 Tax=Parendozoicomonas callyspongiae TaxID=2942213 RepID=A0ABT0PB71_9GAMM|nr:cytochrome c oxidase subunit II [Sansalvadorimonas sp. 2012CJ34-2]MCL6268491.1 cytochrome c oxidase subunit II [Sansalvadorimonas sp. 2012CJ34-2]